MFMEQLDATIVNTAVPAMAQSLHVTPLSLKSVVASYILSLAVFLPASGWAANRFGARSVFACAVSVFTPSSALCSLAMNAPMLVCGRILQGVGAALMVPVGRLAIVRTFPKSELLSRMNFILIPALMGPLLGPTIGGVIVSVTSWRVIFLVNLPVGITALLFIRSCFPDYRATTRSPLDLLGLALFASGTALLSWVLHLASEGGEGRHLGALLTVSGACLAAYGLHSNRRAAPLLDLALFKVRTFRVAVTGGLVTRLGAGGLPFLLPLLYQLGLGFSAWQSGLLMIPSAAAAQDAPPAATPSTPSSTTQPATPPAQDVPANVAPAPPAASQPREWIPEGVAALGNGAASHTDFVLDHSMLVLAAKFDKDNEDLRRVLAGVNGVAVHSFRFVESAVVSPAAMASIDQQYSQAGWQHLVSQHKNASGVQTDLWIHLEQSSIRDIAVLVVAAKQIHFVSASGSVTPLDLLHLSGHFGIPKMDGGIAVPVPGR